MEKKLSSLNYNDLYFLSGGGEMGELIRSTDWSKTSLGDPNEWPQSLRTTVALMLDNPFGMYIAWGPDFIQLYNDGYRPILGSIKHPRALGIGTQETFAEIWSIIGPMFAGVMEGKAVGFADFMLPLNRNGFVEECYFDFSYSPIRKDNGEVGGILVTVIETTNKRKAEVALKESEAGLHSMVLQAPIGICVLDATTLICETVNDSFIEVAGKRYEEIAGKFYWDTFAEARPFYEAALQKVVDEGEIYYANEVALMLIRYGKKEIVYVTFVYAPLKDKEGNVKKVAVWVRENTHDVFARQKVEQSEQETRSLIEGAPFPIGVYKGREMRVAFANKAILDIWGKGDKVIGKLFSDILPELDNQEVFKQLEEVFVSGIAFHIKNQRLDLWVNEKIKPYYFNYSLTPLFDASGKVYGVMNTGADVTDLNMAKLQIQESENKLRNTILQAPIAMCIFMGPKHTVELANDRMIELWGKPAEAFLNKPLFEGLFEAKDQGFEELLDSVYDTGNTVSAESIPVTLPRNGNLELFYVDILYQAYLDPGGSITGILAVAINVTAQVIARKKIEEAEEKARLAINSAELGVYEASYATGEVITDNRFREIMGIDGSVSRSGIVSLFYPDDLIIREEAHKMSLQSGQLNYQARVVHKNAAVRWVRITGNVIFNSKADPERLIGVVQDITASVLAQKKIEESEESIRNMIVQAPVAMCILRGPFHVVEIANNKMFELWGRQESDVLNKPIFEGLPEAKEQGLEKLLQDVFIKGERVVANERPVNLPRNEKIETVYINFVYQALKKADDSISGILAVAVDVTPQVAARQKIEEIVAIRTKDLADANNNLQKSNAELAQFAYIASHDLQEPLRKISTFAQMLENRIGNDLDALSKNYMDKINSSTLRMNRLISDVLAYSELVKKDDIFTAVDLQQVMEGVMTDYELLIEQKEATVMFVNLPVIEAIPLQMSQLFFNLVGNSLKFARADIKPVISISTSVLAPAEKEDLALDLSLDYWKIKFSDNGIGFKEEYSEQIFNIFQRLHRKSEYEGTGIGLAMCRKIVLNHQGGMNALGSSEAGAVFNVMLPVKRGERHSE